MDREQARTRRSPAGIEALQVKALEQADQWLTQAASKSVDARDAANWSLAAKNAAGVAVSCETILKIRRERGR